MTVIPDGHVGTIVTSLEMRRRPLPRPLPASDLRLVRWSRPDPAKYQTLFRRIGEPWLWFSRLIMPDAELEAILFDPGTEVFAVEDRAGIEVGILELNLRSPPECELAFFGFVPELAGQGHGRWLMAHALALAWRPGVDRFGSTPAPWIIRPRSISTVLRASFRPNGTSRLSPIRG